MQLTIKTLILLTFFFACQNAETPNSKVEIIKMPTNPNGDSELALLMREMFEEGQRIKEIVKKGELPKSLKKFKTIYTVEATEPEKAASETYKRFANDYLLTIEKLHNAKPEEIYDNYQSMVQSCMNCHQAMCPGPMVQIKKLYLPTE